MLRLGVIGSAVAALAIAIVATEASAQSSATSFQARTFYGDQAPLYANRYGRKARSDRPQRSRVARTRKGAPKETVVAAPAAVPAEVMAPFYDPQAPAGGASPPVAGAVSAVTPPAVPAVVRTPTGSLPPVPVAAPVPPAPVSPAPPAPQRALSPAVPAAPAAMPTAAIPSPPAPPPAAKAPQPRVLNAPPAPVTAPVAADPQDAVPAVRTRRPPPSAVPRKNECKKFVPAAGVMIVVPCDQAE